MDTITGALRLLILVAMLAQTGSGLWCYVCNSDINEECSREKDLIDCDASSTPTTKYDTCQTTVKHTPETGVSIVKKCAVGPCALGSEQNVALNLNCDRTSGNWECEECCQKDRCNLSAAPGTSSLLPVRGLILAAAMAAILAAILADVRLGL